MYVVGESLKQFEMKIVSADAYRLLFV